MHHSLFFMVSKLPNPSPHTALTATQTPAASVQPSPFLPPLRVQIPIAFSLAATISLHQPPSTTTINLHLRPASQPSVHKGATQLLHPAQLSRPAPIAPQRRRLAPAAAKDQPSPCYNQPLLPQRRNPAQPRSPCCCCTQQLPCPCSPAAQQRPCRPSCSAKAQPSPPAKALQTQLLLPPAAIDPYPLMFF